jgi:hypothetical protein
LKKILFTIIILLININLFAYDSHWDTKDTILQTVFGLTLITDAITTRYFVKRPYYYNGSLHKNPPSDKSVNYAEARESNKILGSHPSTKKLIIYNASVFTGDTILMIITPKSIRNYLQVSGISINAYCTYHNIMGGAKISF